MPDEENSSLRPDIDEQPGADLKNGENHKINQLFRNHHKNPRRLRRA
jgi:hypothetical protein